MAALSAIQSGTKQMAAAAASITIVRGTDTGFDTTVTPGSTILLLTYRAPTANGWNHGNIRWYLTDGNTITVERDSGSTDGTVDVEWVLLSFTSGVVVQHKQVTIANAASTNTAAISAVTLAQSFIVPGGVKHGQNSPAAALGEWKLDSTTQISVTRAGTTGASDFACQVVDYTGCSVQVANPALAASTANTATATVTAVTIANTALIGSCKVDGGYPSAALFEMYLSDTTTVTVTRDDAYDEAVTMTSTVYVVSFSDGTEVRWPGTTALGGTNPVNTTITAVTVAQSVPAFAAIGMSGRSNSGAGSANHYNATAGLTSTTNVACNRATTSNTLTVRIQVLQFPLAVGATATDLRTMPRGLKRGARRGFVSMMSKVNGLWRPSNVRPVIPVPAGA
jgi:hypothetical protein